mgnify:CR=1 FL=1
MDPKGHVAIVTGAASGLGAETAAALAKAGAKVACLDVNIEGATAVASKIGGIAVHCDVTSEAGAVAALKQARDKHDRVTAEDWQSAKLYNAIEPYLSQQARATAAKIAPYGFLIVFALLFIPQLNAAFFDLIRWLFELSGVPSNLATQGWNVFMFWRT